MGAMGGVPVENLLMMVDNGWSMQVHCDEGRRAGVIGSRQCCGLASKECHGEGGELKTKTTSRQDQ